MATTISSSASSPHSFIITLTGNGGAATADRTFVEALGVEGPLRALLKRTPNWTVFNPGGAQCKKIQAREIINRAAGAPPSVFEFFWTTNGIKANSNGTLQLEIRAQHSSRA